MIILSTNSQEVLKERYLNADLNETSWEEVAHRVGYGIGGQEYGENFEHIIREFAFIPAGRILRNVGRKNGSILNCFSLPIGDSRKEIGELFRDALITWGEGGGVGINFSTLRPKGAAIKGVGGHSSGLVSFMRATDGIAATIESGGQRRAAALGLCEVWHPEIKDFIRAKSKDGDISHFNISAGVNEDFIDSVRRDETWRLHWNQLQWETVHAKEIWNLIIDSMYHNGDPGLLNMSTLQTNNSYYFAPIRVTNPCGEAPLEDYGACCLGSIVLTKFVSNGRINWKKLEEVTRYAIRFLDNVLDFNVFTLDKIKRAARQGRRIGLGVMGLADFLFSLGLSYGSRASIDTAERVMKFIRNISYEESLRLAQEKGAFPAFDSNAYCKAKFVRTLPPTLRRDIRKHGVRNVTLLAVAPTGTISLLPEVSSSIEPIMYKAYRRKDRVSTRYYIHPILRTALESDQPIPDWFVDSTDVTPEEHINMQIAIQKYVDGAVSKTILLPADYEKESLSELLLESIDDVKGITVYRDQARTNQPIQSITVNNHEDLVRIDGRGTTERLSVPQVCPTGTCDI